MEPEGSLVFISLHYRRPVDNCTRHWMFPGSSGKNSVPEWKVNSISH